MRRALAGALHWIAGRVEAPRPIDVVVRVVAGPCTPSHATYHHTAEGHPVQVDIYYEPAP